MKRIWLLCVAVWLAFVADEVCAVNPRIKRESSQGAVSFLGKAVSPTDPAPLASYATKRLLEVDNRVQQVVDAELNRDSKPLKKPKCGLVPAADIRNYPFVDRYLDLDDPEISHYFILQEDYVFEGLGGQQYVIPAGFIWDGASISKEVAQQFLEVGNTRYVSAISEGLIHDWMYRNPQKYKKDEADLLFYVNLLRCKNPDSQKMYAGVVVGGGSSYNRHVDNARRGLYDDFDGGFYKNNLSIYNADQMAHNSEASGRDQQVSRDGQLEEKVNTKPVSMDDLKKMDLDDSGGDWCQCANPGCVKKVDSENGKLKSFYIGFRCAHCKKVNVKFAKEALCYEKLIKDAGGDSQWLGQNAEADAKAAGNVK